jgi:hypothetical protein
MGQIPMDRATTPQSNGHQICNLFLMRKIRLILILVLSYQPAFALPPLAGKPTQFNANQPRNIPGSQSDEEAKIGSEGSTDDSFDWSFLSGIIPSISSRVIPGQNQKALNKDNPVWQDSNAGKGLTPVEPYSDLSGGKFVATPDRWLLSKDLNLITESFLDPYNRNPIKGDRPFYRDYFFNFTGISDSLFEYRNVPTPVSSQLSAEDLDASGDQLDLNGKGNQFFFNENITLSFDIYKGDTVFRPPDDEFRFTPVINYDYTTAQEVGVLNVNPEKGKTRSITGVGMQELFYDHHLRNVSDRYDFDSIRVGVQPINVDFRGFLFLDNALGVRLLGNRDNNRWQYNLAAFSRLEKNINTGLNNFGMTPRNDQVYIANLYRQDFPFRGFTSQLAVIYNRNTEGDNAPFYDQNGFPSRPALIGNMIPKNYDVQYLGYNGDGHFNRLNLTTSNYYLMGTQNNGSFEPGNGTISSWFTANEGSVDFDWSRVRLSVVHASGDKNPYDSKSTGFDAIQESPQIAGGDTSFWIGQGVALIGGGGVTVNGRNSLLPDLRSSKILGQSNFENPGVSLFGIGSDHDILPEVRISTNFNKLFFDNTSTLEVARNQGNISNNIGWDISSSIIYRPMFNQNIIVKASGATLIPSEGAIALFGNHMLYQALFNVVLKY